MSGFPARGRFAGFAATGAKSIITNCQIVKNELYGLQWAGAPRSGGGAYLQSSAQMWNCLILSNYTILGGGAGAGIVLATGSSDSFISFLTEEMMFAAPEAPITATCAVGQASTISDPISLFHIPIYAPPYAFLNIIVTMGTVASQYA